MSARPRSAFVISLVGIAARSLAVAGGAPLPVGAAKVDITPTEPVVLAGYGGRTREFEGIDGKLWARAMVIGEDRPVAVVVVDNCGVPEPIVSKLAKRLDGQGIDRGQLVVAATHTHNAPNLVGYAPVLWAGRTTPAQQKRMAAYSEFIVDAMERAVREALANRRPMTLEWAQGRATFGGNRRVTSDGRWTGFGFQRSAPVDHSLPVLAARDADGKLRVVWANYACHCTTVGSRNHVGGDWAGFANDRMEREFAGALALMSIGCGADIGPQPSGGFVEAEGHGQSIAAEVARLLAAETKPLSGMPEARTRRVQLPLETPDPRAHWERAARGSGFDAQLAKAMLRELDADGAIHDSVDYPISAWTFGEDLALLFLAGEVVVDYSVRLNRELDWSRLWITAWANDMPGYIPSKRVLAEGGYEADFSQVYYAQPGRYRPEVEDILVSAVHELLGGDFAAADNQEPAPFHRLPSGEAAALAKLRRWAADTENRELRDRFSMYARTAQPAVGELPSKGGEQTEWYDYAGDFVSRRFIRQTKEGLELAWETPDASRSRVLCFTGGVGWESEPETAGFALQVGEADPVHFDVTRAATRWNSADGTTELLYLPTWSSGVDSGGFFFIKFKEPHPGTTRIAVRSLGSGSKRWFAVDSKQDIEARLKRLAKVLVPQENEPCGAAPLP